MNNKGLVGALASIPLIGWIATIALGGAALSAVSYFLFHTLVPVVLILGLFLGGGWIAYKGINLDTKNWYAKLGLSGVGLFLMMVGLLWYQPTGGEAFQVYSQQVQGAEEKINYQPPGFNNEELTQMKIFNAQELEITKFPYFEKLLVMIGALGVIGVAIVYQMDEDYQEKIDKYLLEDKPNTY